MVTLEPQAKGASVAQGGGDGRYPPVADTPWSRPVCGGVYGERHRSGGLARVDRARPGEARHVHGAPQAAVAGDCSVVDPAARHTAGCHLIPSTAPTRHTG